MILVISFLVLFVAGFAVVALLTRPSRSEALVQSRLQAIGRPIGQRQVEAVDILKKDTLSDLGWFNDILSRFGPAVQLRRLISEADQPWTVGRLISGSLLAGVVVLWFGRFVLRNHALLFLVAVVAMFLPFAYLYIARTVRFRKCNEQLPAAVDLLARALKAGHSLSAAIEMVSQENPPPLGPEFRRVFEEQSFGLPFRDALFNLTARLPLDDLRFIVTAMLIQRETGGNLVEVLEKTSSVLRDRIRLKGQLRVHTAQGRLTGWILCLLPFVSFLALSVINPTYTDLLLNDPLGRHLVWAGLALMGLGIFVIRKIIDIKV
ncbi:type II secretion system F family protein [Edaphobacter bradus]|uniref:type II secretion system F family protein n=1 Tax=Edaphobacter bradus TaxID=2259016 RepID=UPI0021DF4DF8|nr:type II secretion system F family protein [Edaphobacter bradus]